MYHDQLWAAISEFASHQDCKPRTLFLPAPQIVAFFEQPGLEEYHDQLWAATDPSRRHVPFRVAGHGHASVTVLLPRIQLARRLLVEVGSLGLCIKGCVSYPPPPQLARMFRATGPPPA